MLNTIEKTYRELIQQGRPIVRLFSGNPVEQGIVFPGEILKKEYEKYFGTMEYRPDPKGDRVARVAIQKYYERHKVSFDPENILITSGTSESYLHIFSLLTQPGDNILVPHPGYPLFDHVAETVRTGLRPYRLMEDFQWALDMDSLLSAIDERTRAIVLISPHNPTGSILSEAELREVVDIANERGLGIISDEVFSEFVFDGLEYPRAARVTWPNLLFTLNGLSKMFALPSMKLSWITVSGEPQRVDAAVDSLETKIDTFLTCHTAIQKIVPAVFREGQDFLQSYRTEVERRCTLAMQELQAPKKISLNPPRGGFYLTARLDLSGLSEEEFVIRLMQETGVFVHPGYFYDCGPGAHMVLSFLTEEKSLKEGIGKIVQFLSMGSRSK